MRTPRFTCVTLFLALSFTAIAQSDTREENRADGTLAARYAVDEAGLRHGTFTAYSLDGKRAVENATYEHGKLTGSRRRFDDKGLLLADETWREGMLLYPKTIQQIKSTLARIEAQGKTGDAKPGKGPTGLTLPSAADLNAALAKVKAYRFLCGVPYEDLVIDPEMVDICQHGCELLAKLRTLQHYPKKPAGMDETYFKRAYRGTSESNLSMGARMQDTPMNYMDDSDASNIDRVGHRRWLLNPQMDKTGFGMKGAYSAMYVFGTDRAEVPPECDTTCYPSRGHFPLSHFQASYAWHFAVHSGYKPPDAKCKVSVFALNTQLARVGEALRLNYFKASGARGADGGALIFRPEKPVLKAGQSYEVEITGLVTKDGKSDPVKYVVTFF